MIALIKKRYCTRQPGCTNLWNNVFINKTANTSWRLSCIVIFRFAQSFPTRTLRAHRSLSVLACHDSNEDSNELLQLIAEFGRNRISFQVCGRNVRSYISREMKKKSAEAGWRKERKIRRKRERERRELLIRRRARIPCRSIYRTPWLWLCEVSQARTKRGREKEKGRGSTWASLTGRVN